MKVLIHIELLNEPSASYVKEMMSWAREAIKDLVTFDLDNFSDQYMFKYAMELIEKEEKIVIIIDVKEKAQAGKILGLIEKIIKHKDKCLVMMNGENAVLEKMLSLLGQNYKSNISITEQKEQTALFLMQAD
jgi:hypothetical protein